MFFFFSPRPELKMHGLKLPGSHPATECQTRPEQRLSAPSHPDDATATPRPPGGSPISLHVYKAPGSREDIVTGADKEGILYVPAVPSSLPFRSPAHVPLNGSLPS